MTTLLGEKLIALQKLGVSEEVGKRLQTHIEDSDQVRLRDISPSRMADEWNLPRREVLEAFLYGTRLGIFDLTWNIRCPSCKGHPAQTKELTLLKPEAYCQFCQLDVQASFDEAVEVSFTVNDNIRKIEPVSFNEYVSSWELTDARATFNVEAKSAQKKGFDLVGGAYYLTDTTFNVGIPLLIDHSPAQSGQELQVSFDGENLTIVNAGSFHSGPLTLKVTNHSEAPVDLTLAYRKEYPWTSAAQIASTQSFRDLFSTELISTDETFSIRNLVIVFTDIKGSTALYERLGDSDAYFLVKEHFKILTQRVRKHNGAVVKTIGDAVMATFMVSADAIEALFDMQQAFDEFNAREQTRDDIIIKVGAHRGPCIAVTSNDRLDYFGRTVNIAARVQGLSSGQDIVFTKSFYDEPPVQEIVDSNAWQARHFQAALRGIEDRLDIVHLRPRASR